MYVGEDAHHSCETKLETWNRHVDEVPVTAFWVVKETEEIGKFSTAAAGSELLPPLGRSEGNCTM